MTRHVHFLGIAGYAVSGAALLARQMGYVVTGSDEDAYPPTTEILDRAGIPWVNQHSPGNLVRHGLPQQVVIGGQVRAGNPEWEAAVRLGLSITSEAEFYSELTADRLRIAVCGTHGKTTTSALLALMLERAGLDPGFRLGSTSRDFHGVAARLGTGPFVFEGDEYITAPWDARAKFLHVHPTAACVTRLELDHPDVYTSLDAYRAPFAELAAAMPTDGLLVLNADDRECRALADHAACEVQCYGTAGGVDWQIGAPRAGGAGQLFQIRRDGGDVLELELTLPGLHNAGNAAAALALAARCGADIDRCVAACADFRGASRRFEVLGSAAGVTVVDDYAHHPTEVAATIAAARQRYGRARLVVVYVPHTFSRTLALLEDYRSSFVDADVVVLGPIEPARERHLAHTVSSHDIAARIAPPTEVRVVAGADEAVATVTATARDGDVVLCLSVRGFDGVAARILARQGAVHSG